jgi:hypothetical protein
MNTNFLNDSPIPRDIKRVLAEVVLCNLRPFVTSYLVPVFDFKIHKIKYNYLIHYLTRIQYLFT